MSKLEDLKENIEKIGSSAEVAGKNIGNFADIYRMFEGNRRRWWEIEDKLARIKYLTGYTLDDLLEKFTAGWELVAPDGETLSMSDLMKGD